MEAETFVEIVSLYKNKISIVCRGNYFTISQSTYYRWTKKRSKEDTRISGVKVLVNHKSVQRIIRTMF